LAGQSTHRLSSVCTVALAYPAKQKQSSTLPASISEIEFEGHVLFALS
jgi:hypothetical protein